MFNVFSVSVFIGVYPWLALLFFASFPDFLLSL